MELENFFNPKSVAVIGASNDPSKVGFALMSNLKNGSERKIFPVSISEKEIMGIPTHASILEIEETIDLAVIAVRSDFVPKILLECAEKKIKSVIIISAGFKEIGPAGSELENKIAEIAKENGISLLGPNCLGTIDTQENFNATFAAGSPPIGNIAFLSQSGALGTAFLDMAISEGVGFSKFISLGNEADLTEIDFLKFLADDPKTKSILIYLEKLSDGPEFMKLCSEITKKKPVVVLKAGRSSRGAKAVSSHTGSLAPDDAIFSAACKQVGVTTVNSIREFFNMAKLFQTGFYKPLQKICILTNGGGPSVVTTDLIDLSKSLSLADISEVTKEKLRKVLPPMAAFGNPVDIIGDALSDRFENALQILVEEKETDAILLLVTPQMMTEMQKTAELVVKYSKTKPIIPVFLGGPQIKPALQVLQKNKMVNFDFPIDAVSALDSLALGKTRAPLVNPEPTRGVFVTTKMMDFQNMSNLLAEYDIPLSGVFIKDKFELGAVLRKLKFDTFVMKAESGDLVHKTDAGAVVLNLKSAEDAEKAWEQIRARNPKADIEGMLIQPTSQGREVIIGMKRDTTFGATVLFGLGGILAEAIKDTTLRVAPVEKSEALKMMQEIKGLKILEGLRGEKPVNFDALTEIISNLSRLAVDHPEIKEIDLNPVMATDLGATVVDARIMI
jgi:acetyltransferase